MGPIRLDEAAGLTVADVVHSRVSALPASSTIGDVRAWFAALDPDHPAHQERIPLNHPRAIISPPYFDDE